MLKDARTYEIMSATDIGGGGSRWCSASTLAARAATRLEELGLLLTQEELNHAFTGFKTPGRLPAGSSPTRTSCQIAQNGRRAADGVFDAIGHVYRVTAVSARGPAAATASGPRSSAEAVKVLRADRGASAHRSS